MKTNNPLNFSAYINTTTYYLFIFLLFVYHCHCFPKPNESINFGKTEGIEILASYPRSGSHWAYCILQMLVGKPVVGRKFDPLNPQKNIELNNYSNAKIDINKPFLFRTHKPYEIPIKLNSQTNKLFTIVRNYKECITREQDFNANSLLKSIINDSQEFHQYIEILNYFNDWEDCTTKLLIYYEDLISKPKETIEKMLVFFEESTEGLDNFIENIDEYKRLSIERYQKIKANKKYQNNIPSSGGDKKIYHSKDFPDHIIKEIDDHIKDMYPHLWKKYLKRYESFYSRLD